MEHCKISLLAACAGLLLGIQTTARAQAPPTRTIEVPLTSHDGYEMFGKLTIPASAAPRLLVVYVQTAEGMTGQYETAKRPRGNFQLFRSLP